MSQLIDPGRQRTHSWQDPAPIHARIHEADGLTVLRDWAEGRTPPPPVAGTLGFAVARVESGRVTVTLTAAEFHCVRTGIVHGGIAATLCDTACGFAVHSLLPAGAYAVSADLNLRYLRPVLVTSGTLTCTGTVKEVNARSALAQAELTGPDGALLAHATSTVLIRGTDPSHPTIESGPR
ncbi:PaaI family thioesterase [Streptomyces netropsis]